MALRVLLLTSMAAYHTTTIDFSSSCISFPFHPTRHFQNDAEVSLTLLIVTLNLQLSLIKMANCFSKLLKCTSLINIKPIDYLWQPCKILSISHWVYYMSPFMWLLTAGWFQRDLNFWVLLCKENERPCKYCIVPACKPVFLDGMLTSAKLNCY